MNSKVTSRIVGGGKNDRLSNFEALRLLSMLMVLNLHSFKGYNHGDGVIQMLDFFRESTSICAVNAFILISGYFGIKWKFKSFFNLVFQVLFYSFVVYGVAVIIGAIAFSKSEFLECFKALYKSWGFISWYIILYFFSPILNAFAEKSTSKELLCYIMILFFAENFVFMSAGAINFCLVYLIGQFIRKVEMPAKLKINATSAYWITTLFIFIVAYALFLSFHWGAEQMAFCVIAYSYSSPFVILQAIFLFLIFSRLNIQSKFINWCASSCLAIFLIHMHPAIKYIGYYNFTESLYERSVLEHVVILLFFIFIVFFGSILVDKVRIVISDLCYKFLEILSKQIPRKCLTLETLLPGKVHELI